MTSGVAAIPTSVAPLPRDQLVACLQRDTDLALTMLMTFAGCVRSAVEHLHDLRVGNAVSLVAARLVQLARDPTFESIRFDRGGTIQIEMPMTQQELASWAGVSYRSATNALQQLRDERLISTSRHHLEIRHHFSIVDVADGEALARQGNPTTEFVVVLSGRIGVSLDGSPGRFSRASFNVLEPSRIAIADRGQFFEILKNFPVVGRRILQIAEIRRAYLLGHADGRALEADRETSPFPVHLLDRV